MADTVRLSDARAPDGMRIYAIGDVHGCARHLAEMHAQIRGEIIRDRPADWRIIHVGDYCDRGPDTRGVIEMLARARQDDPRYVMLCGNHDAGMIEFLETGESDGIFANNGGDKAAASYGVALDFSSAAAALRGRDALRAAMPASHCAFLDDLPLSVTLGDYFFCHAGVRPGVPLDQQSPHDLLWIRGTFHRHEGLYSKVIIHGHTPHEEPEIRDNRINLDTGACFTGTLTAVMLEGREKRLLSVAP